ncbi:hypothetical protein GCM10007981_02440 [Thermocladium modestius]|uniref:Aspartate/glutamate/uridylate kinase domain-containing protein n=2 Tax=Thermocladium modestius TaxID=62609 RepID=A0A830GTA7_9CREN|nr:hypothetical protein GCM10007981_02440 [Thermocladium modestius]
MDGCVVVISAMKGVTDKLMRAAQEGRREDLADVLGSYEDALRYIAPSDYVRYSSMLDIIGGSARRYLSVGDVDAVAAHGELLSATVMAAALEARGTRSTAVYDPGIVLERPGGVSGLSGFYVRQRLLHLIERGVTPVVPGFIGWTPDGKPATLGRGGSDYTASLLANYLGASRVFFYTDVPGIYSGDPNIIGNPKVINCMNVEEAYVFSAMGGKKFHPRTFEPLIGTRITAFITSPGSTSGTLISKKAGAGPKAVALFDALRIGRRGRAVAIIGKVDPRDLPFNPDFKDSNGNAFGKVFDDEERAVEAAKELHDWVISWAR